MLNNQDKDFYFREDYTENPTLAGLASFYGLLETKLIAQRLWLVRKNSNPFIWYGGDLFFDLRHFHYLHKFPVDSEHSNLKKLCDDNLFSGKLTYSVIKGLLGIPERTLKRHSLELKQLNNPGTRPNLFSMDSVINWYVKRIAKKPSLPKEKAKQQLWFYVLSEKPSRIAIPPQINNLLDRFTADDLKLILLLLKSLYFTKPLPEPFDNYDVLLLELLVKVSCCNKASLDTSHSKIMGFILRCEKCGSLFIKSRKKHSTKNEQICTCMNCLNTFRVPTEALKDRYADALNELKNCSEQYKNLGLTEINTPWLINNFLGFAKAKTKAISRGYDCNKRKFSRDVIAKISGTTPSNISNRLRNLSPVRLKKIDTLVGILFRIKNQFAILNHPYICSFIYPAATSKYLEKFI